MQTSANSEKKSVGKTAFEHYLRTGERLTESEWQSRQEYKFNPWHDDKGRFTNAPNASMGNHGATVTPTGRSSSAHTAAAGGKVSSQEQSARQGAIAPIQGYPETKRTEWRNSNDEAFTRAANEFNQKYNFKPGDPQFITPRFMKAWAMIESGGEGDRSAFLSDPFQVNKPLDWAPEKRDLGLSYGQRMSPYLSAKAALEWLHIKGNKKLLAQIENTFGVIWE